MFVWHGWCLLVPNCCNNGLVVYDTDNLRSFYDSQSSTFFLNWPVRLYQDKIMFIINLEVSVVFLLPPLLVFL